MNNGYFPERIWAVKTGSLHLWRTSPADFVGPIAEYVHRSDYEALAKKLDEARTIVDELCGLRAVWTDPHNDDLRHRARRWMEGK